MAETCHLFQLFGENFQLDRKEDEKEKTYVLLKYLFGNCDLGFLQREQYNTGCIL